jgi:uncharacterized protein YndB with AHSA1/START domain
MVGAARLHAHHAQQGLARGRQMALHHARAGWQRLAQCHALPRGGTAAQTGLRPRRHRRHPAPVPRHRVVRRGGWQDPHGNDHGRTFIKHANGDSTWDRLAEYLGKRLRDEEVFVINRSFEAPRDVVFDMWTKPEHLARWLPPTGMEMRFLRADIRTGGASLYCMSNDAITMYGRAHYELIRRPDLLVYTQQFCDENENIARHPMAPVWPETMRTTVQFSAETENRTRVTVTWEAAGQATSEELAAFLAHRASMTQGWTGSFDKLEAELA